MLGLKELGVGTEVPAGRKVLISEDENRESSQTEVFQRVEHDREELAAKRARVSVFYWFWLFKKTPPTSIKQQICVAL